ncbi:hypothetical protein V8E51_011254 [Hyaloscypha variabilis]|jgi:hypothetical protein|uniref:Uncharacterized protein n=1 Tax=Hyaloscypha variabilis (strain UAMH 11265 / GT02V1 / F) TaxID=1149755 RepID=A0A2J6RXM6_HYAVF|nr:hypothetical protein L207DRAFT_292370 [Hyaloscypha variabilis F]
MSSFVSSQIQGQIPRAKCTNPTIHPYGLIWAVGYHDRTPQMRCHGIQTDCLRWAANYNAVSISICGLADNLERGWQRAYPSIGAQLHPVSVSASPSPSACDGESTSADVYLASARREGVLGRGTSTENCGRDALQAIRSRTNNSVQPVDAPLLGRKGKNIPRFAKNSATAALFRPVSVSAALMRHCGLRAALSRALPVGLSKSRTKFFLAAEAVVVRR